MPPTGNAARGECRRGNARLERALGMRPGNAPWEMRPGKCSTACRQGRRNHRRGRGHGQPAHQRSGSSRRSSARILPSRSSRVSNSAPCS